jgi:two-component system sensor histidine kinase PilS (NtrC family)
MLQIPTPVTAYQPRTLLRIYAYYRVALATTLLGLFHPAVSFFPEALGSQHSSLFAYTIYSYFAVTLITLARLYSRGFQSSDQFMFLVCFIDVVCLALLMHASGGIDTGLGLLLLVTVSAASITLNGQIAILIAALAALAILTSTLSGLLYQKASLNNLLPAGLLGFLFFVTSQLFLYLTRRIRDSVAEAELQAQRRTETQHLNEMIVRRMQTGLMVLAGDGRIRLMNDSAARLLDMPQAVDSYSAVDISSTSIPGVQQRLEQWRASPRTRIKPFHLREGGPELQLSFAALNPQEYSDTLIFVEDVKETLQQAQQLKLASLGHLTANIAHEVRNPLGAISHAAQLLAESPQLPVDDQRLSHIIQTHCLRVNQIIENVLQLSRRLPPRPEKISLREWLTNFIQHYQQSHTGNILIEVQCDHPDIIINVDASQMEQVMTNLCDNGLRHSAQATGKATVLLQAYLDPSLGTPCLDIIDDGAGIPTENIPRIFEPFFTTESQGTGLGLYIAREICEANQTQLTYKRNAEGKSSFQINFSHPDKSLINPDLYLA